MRNKEINKVRKNFYFAEGDLVCRKNFENGKLERNFLGPFLVLRVIDVNRIEIDEVTKTVVHNVKNLKPFMGKWQDEVPSPNEY